MTQGIRWKQGWCWPDRHHGACRHHGRHGGDLPPLEAIARRAAHLPPQEYGNRSPLPVDVRPHPMLLVDTATLGQRWWRQRLRPTSTQRNRLSIRHVPSLLTLPSCSYPRWRRGGAAAGAVRQRRLYGSTPLGSRHPTSSFYSSSPPPPPLL